jgi:predicted enzyme related to lactoylglutathione lyase
MSEVTHRQPLGTPTWIDLGIPDLAIARDFYGALFGWEFADSGAEAGHYTMCLLRGRPVAALAPTSADESAHWWNVYLATDDCDATVARITAAGGRLVLPTTDVPGQGRMAIAIDPVGGQFGLWQAGGHVGCALVNEPGTLIRNDLVTADPEPARRFYAEVFDFTLDGNPDLPEWDFTFLRRPDGHEIGGIMGVPEAAPLWQTTFEVADTDAALEQAREHGGRVGVPEDFVYGRMAQVTDPFGAEFSVITRP